MLALKFLHALQIDQGLLAHTPGGLTLGSAPYFQLLLLLLFTLEAIDGAALTAVASIPRSIPVQSAAETRGRRSLIAGRNITLVYGRNIGT